TLIWPLGGIGLAISTTLVSVLQSFITAWLLQERVGRLDWSHIGRTLGKTLLATGLMTAACLITASLLSQLPIQLGRAARLGLPLVSGLVVYLLVAKVIGLDEPWMLLRRERIRVDEIDAANPQANVITPSE